MVRDGPHFVVVVILPVTSICMDDRVAGLKFSKLIYFCNDLFLLERQVIVGVL